MSRTKQVAKTIAKTLIPLQARQALRTLEIKVRERHRIPILIKRFCVGQGVEIGAGKDPYCSPSNTVFLDKHTDNAQGTPGADIVADAAQVPMPDASFDFVLSSHCLEHSQNTILTLNEWIRLLKPDGILFLILPHGDRTFDKHRAKTTLEHHIQDFETLGTEPDRSHIEETEEGLRALDDLEDYIAHHTEVWGADFWDWDHRLENDALHFHVWTQDEIVKLLQYLHMRIVLVDEEVPERSDSFVVVARAPATTGA